MHQECSSNNDSYSDSVSSEFDSHADSQKISCYEKIIINASIIAFIGLSGTSLFTDNINYFLAAVLMLIAASILLCAYDICCRSDDVLPESSRFCCLCPNL
jgi:hypothetical protein